MSAVTVRDAVEQDASALSPLMATLGYPADAATIAGRLRALAADDPTGRVLVASMGEAVLGFAVLHCTPALHRPTAVGRVTAIAVLSSAQSAGVGRELMAEAERYFFDLGLGRIEVTSGLTHTEAYSFYRRLGYADHGVRFAKTLPAGEKDTRP